MKSPLVCGGTGQESGEGLVCSSPRPRGHISVRGSFFLTLSNCTARGSLRALGPLYLQQALTYKCSKRLGRGEKGALPSRKPISWLLSFVPWWASQSEAQTFSLVLGGFWRIVWLATGPAYEPREWLSQQSQPFSCGSHCSPFTMPGSRQQLGQEEVVAEFRAGMLGEAAP